MLIKIEFKDTEFTFNEINQDNIANVIHSEPGINILQSFLSIPTNSFLKKNDNKKPMIINIRSLFPSWFVYDYNMNSNDKDMNNIRR